MFVPETGSVHFVRFVCGDVEVKSVAVWRPQFEGSGGDTTPVKTFTQNFIKIGPVVWALAQAPTLRYTHTHRHAHTERARLVSRPLHLEWNKN